MAVEWEQSCILFDMFCVQVFTFLFFLSLTTQMAGWYVELDHDLFHQSGSELKNLPVI
jgi:hypothetical protein